MGRNTRSTQSGEKRGSIYRFTRMFSSKRKKDEKRAVLSDMLDTQNKMLEKLTSFACTNMDFTEGIQSLTEKVERFNRNLSEHSMAKNNQDILHDLCNQLRNTRMEEKSLTEEIKALTEKIHQREIEICKLDSKSKDFNKEMSRKEEKYYKMEENVNNLKNSLETLKEEKMDLKLEIQKRENTIQELKSYSTCMEVKMEKLKENIKEQESRIQELKEEKQRIMEYSASRCKLYEDRLRVAWVKFNGVKQERDELIQANADKAPIYKTNHPRDTSYQGNETKILQLELKLYRRDRLVEMLAEKLKTHEPEFSLLSDPNLMIYLDQDWYALAVDSNSDQGSEATSIPSSTQSSLESDE